MALFCHTRYWASRLILITMNFVPCRIDSMCKEHEKAETKGQACASKAVVQVVQLQGRLSLLWSVQLLYLMLNSVRLARSRESMDLELERKDRQTGN